MDRIKTLVARYAAVAACVAVDLAVIAVAARMALR